MMNSFEQADTLKAKHHDLDEALSIESNRPHPDDIAVVDLKKKKLRIKDKLAEISH